ncbi:MAG: FAD-binding protein, partial [Thiolinea sp.]
YYRSLLDEQGVETKIVATASTTEMVRSLVGAGVGVSILNMCPATALSYAGDKVCVLPITSAVRPLRLVLGHQGGNRRRLLQVFIEACRKYFASEAAAKLVVSNKPFTAEPVNTNDLAEAFRAELPDIQCLDQSCDLAVYEQGARGESGRAVFVMQPQTTQDVSRCVAWCIAHDVSFIPQSGNTGLVGASVPDNSGTQVVLSLRKVRSVFALDTVNRSVTVSAGLRLSELNNRLEKDQLFLPVDLSADPMIGGMIATNTGGSRFLRYGDMRRQVLGLTVVLPDKYGTVLHLGSTARKNNIGLDEKQRYIGTSGRFGVITEAALSLEYAPQQQAVALVIPKDDQAVVTLLGFLELHLGSLLSAYELMSGNAMRHALNHASSLKNPFAGAEIPDVALLVELTRSGAETDWDTPLQEVLEHILEQAWELHGDSIQDALFGRAEAFWSLRHAISEGVKAAGKLFAFDLGFARQQALAFRSAMMVELPRHFPELEICDFGHIGDGGLHFNLVCHQQQLAAQPDYEQKLRDWVMEQAVTRFGASFSAEHGIGPKNQRYLERYGNQQFGCLPT